MPACAPQRFLANNRNKILAAILTPSSVLPVAQQVIEIPVARKGTAQVQIAGSYTGSEDAQYDIQIVDTAITNPLISTPIFSGEGTGTLQNIESALDAQVITVQLNDDGTPVGFAAVAFEGSSIVARAGGAAGNDIRIDVDQSGLVFSPTSFSLLQDIKAGQGDPNSVLVGAAFDWDTKVLGADNIIPADAHRVSFGDDHSRIYLQCKRFANGDWGYIFVPALQADVPAGTRVNFVTGGRTVTISSPALPATETYNDVVTDYDLLNAIQTTSALVMVDGVVANDRSPTGQAARELAVRTDAHADVSTGSGSAAAQGFVDTFAGALANTELVTATCFAVNPKDDVRAHLGSELWKLKGSVSGDLGEIVTGVPYAEPTGLFGLTIPTRLPDGFGGPKGKFDVISIDYVARPEGQENPPICVGDLTLGIAAVDQSIQLKWTKRPSGECQCLDMPFDPVSDACLGIETEEGGPVDYSPEALSVLSTLWGYYVGIANSLTDYRSGNGAPKYPDSAQTSTPGVLTATWSASGQGVSTTEAIGADALAALPTTVPIFTEAGSISAFIYNYAEIPQAMIDFAKEFETAVARIDALDDGTIKTAGFSAMDTCSGVLNTDITAIIPGVTRLIDINVQKYRIYISKALITAGLSPLGKTSASTEISEDGCWQDLGDAFYWEVVGSDGGKYAPAFMNHVYYSSRRASQTDAYYSTKEFALQVNCNCTDRVKEGDTINLSIGGSGFGATYQVGDALQLPIIAAQDLYLAGGQDGNAIQVWNVSGSDFGPMPNYTYDPNSPSPYSNGSPSTLSFLYVPGGIASKKGDRFQFAIEGGRYRVRKDGGAWSAPINIPIGATALDGGLTLEFITGAAPSFVGGDTYSFNALQPWAVSNVRSPTGLVWRWASSSPDVVTLVADMLAPQNIEMAAVDLHTIPEGATITIEGGTSAGVYPHSEVVTWQPGSIVHMMASAWNVRYLRLTIEDSGESQVGWFWAGEPLSSSLSAEAQRKRQYLISRTNGGLFQGGKSLAKTVGFDITWTEGSMSEADAEGFEEFLDWIKGHDDEPFIFVPQIERLADAALQRVVDDSIELTDMSAYNRGASFERRLSVTFSTTGVWR